MNEPRYPLFWPVNVPRSKLLWYKVDQPNVYDEVVMQRALRYLSARKMLKRHPRFPHLVKVLKVKDGTL